LISDERELVDDLHGEIEWQFMAGYCSTPRE
jgi:hypothetical protein